MPTIASTSEDPPSTLARAVRARANPVLCTAVPARDPTARMTLDEWLAALEVLERRALGDPTRERIVDSRAVCSELARVLDGKEAGEGRASDRTLHLATARGRVQGICSMFACPRATFVELLASAPWNLVGPSDPCDPRTVRGAGTALVAAARTWSVARGCGGAVALQAATTRAAAFYEKLGFRLMRADDDPLTLVPPGDDGWSPSIERIARGRPGDEERVSPWMLLEARPALAEWTSVPAVG